MEQRRRITKGKTKPKQAEKPQKNPLVSEIWAVLLTAFGVILILSFYFDATGPFGEFLKSFGRGMLGIPSFVLPALVTYGGVKFIIKREISTRGILLTGGILFIVSAFFHLFSSYEFTGVVDYYHLGILNEGGGVIGGIIATPLALFASKWGAFVLLLALAVIMIIALTKISLSDILKSAAEKIRERSQQEKEEYVYEYESKLKNKRETTPPKKEEEPFEPEIKIFTNDQLGLSDAVEEKPAPEADKPAEKKVKAVDAEEIEKEIEKAKPVIDYKFPPPSLLENHASSTGKIKPEDLREKAKKLVDTLKSFGVEAKVLEVSRGPSVTRFELQPSAGVKVSKIVNLADDIALNLAAFGVRIEAPIPGKAAVGIEIPNQSISTVSLKDVLESKEFTSFKSKTAFALGKDISGKPIVADISKMPHLLIAGATGSGKSVSINTLITSIIYKANPNEVKLLMIDPKVVELGVYNGIPHLLIPVVTDPRKAAGALNWAVSEMTNRYKMFADCNVRDIGGYNDYALQEELDLLEKIVIIIDELSDLMMVAPHDVEDAICRLAQMARAAGMHLVIATQRPSVDVITGLIKANIPSRISFAVSSQIDSRTILDMMGAEKLLGRGDMLYLPVGASKPTRVQGAYISDKEVENIVDYIKNGFDATYDEEILEKIQSGGEKEEDEGAADELLPQAIEIVVDAGQASVSLVQRRLKVGYSRAGRIVDQMEARGIIGPHEGSKPRQVLITRQEFYEMSMNTE